MSNGHDWLNQHPTHRQPRVVYVPVRRRRRPPRRFRWWILAVVGVVLFFMWLSTGLGGLRMSWNDLLTGPLGVEDPGRLTELATLGCLIVAGLLVWRVIKGTRKDSE